MNPPVECILSRVIVLRHGYTVLFMLRVVHSSAYPELPRAVSQPCLSATVAVLS